MRRRGTPSGETPLDNPGYTCPACKRPRNPARFPNPWTGWVRVDAARDDDDDDEFGDEFGDDPERAAPRQWRFVCQGCAYAARMGTVASATSKRPGQAHRALTAGLT